MDYKKVAQDILRYVGTQENIQSLEHCSTRIRIFVNNKGLVNVEQLKKIKGVLGVIVNTQVQVIIGNSVVEVYHELMKLYEPDKQLSNKPATEKKKLGALLLEYIIGIFQPLVPAIAGAGVLKSIMILLATFSILDKGDGIYLILNSIADATFYFLPLMVAITTANKLQSNRLVALAAVGVFLLPANIKLLGDGLNILGFSVKNIAYHSQVFPAILITLFVGVLEKTFNKITPKSIRIFFVPMVSLGIAIPIGYLLLGPIGYVLGEYLTQFILFLYHTLGFLGLALLAGVLPFMIAAGMHKAMVPYAVSTFTKLGYEMMYLPASLAHNISESGACFAVALKSKNAELKSTALSAGISALMGITEPALYGVTLLHKRILYSVMLSGCIGGAFVGIVGLKSFVLAGPGLANITMFIDAENSKNFIFGCVGFLISLCASFVLTLVLFKDEEIEKENTAADNGISKLSLYSPMCGKQIALKDLSDEMFSNATLGEGTAIIPAEGKVYAPCNAIVKMVFESKHALGLELENGAELLIHVGIDTVRLNGMYFNTLVKEGDHVSRGDVLLEFDLEAIKQAGYEVTTPIVVTNGSDYYLGINKNGDVNLDSILMNLERK